MENEPVNNEPAAPVENVAAPAPAPEPTPAPAANEPAPAPTPSNVPKGTSASEIDTEALLDKMEAESAEEQRLADEAKNNPAPEPTPEPAPPTEPVVENPEPNNEPAPTENTVIDPAEVENYYTTPEIPELGIKPLPELRNPEQGETANDYFKNVTLPAIIQTVHNVAGFATRNAQVKETQQTQEQQRAQDAYLDGITSEIKGLQSRGLIKDITEDANGKIDANSPGGKIVGEVFKYIKEENAKPENKDSQIRNFSTGFVAWQADAVNRQAADVKKQQNQTRLEKAKILSSNGTGASGAKTPNAPSIRKGTRATDIDFDSILG